MADTANITLKGESEAINFIDEALRGDIAYEELSTTVSKTGGYVAGDHLIYLGQYYEVVADIAQGGTIVTSGAGQNVEEREVGDEIKKNKTQVLGVICDVETSPATAAHSAGDQFYYDGALVEATSAIAIGDTIVVSPDTGYNVKVADKVVAQMQTLTSALTNYVNNNGAKNLLPTPYYTTKGGTTTSGALTVTENADGSVTINGTNTGQSYVDLARNDKSLKAGTYILSGGLTSKQYVYINCLNNGTYIKTLVKAMTSEAKFVLDYNGYDAITVGISIASGEALSNTTFYPMIRLASDTDNTYQPYAKTNQLLTQDSVTWDNLSEVGAVNYLNSAITTQTKNGATYTNLGDGKYKVGASEAPSYTSSCISTIAITLKKGTYKWTASEDGESPIGSDNCYAFIRGLNGTVDWYRSYQSSHGYGVFTLTQDSTIEFGLAVNSSTAFSEITFYPMITPVSYNGPYVPYAKTNRELTEVNEYEVDTTSISGVQIIKRNNVVTVKVNSSFNIVHNQNYVVGQLPERFRPPMNVVVPITTNEGTPKLTVLAINSTGQIEINGYMIATSGTYPFDGTMTFVTNK